MTNKEIAKKIVEKAETTEVEVGIDFNLISVIGYRREILFTEKLDTKAKLVKDLEKDIEKQLDDKTLILSDSFIASL